MDDRQLKCAAQHFGLWAVQPRWMDQAVSAYNAGTLPKVAADGFGDALYVVDHDGVATVDIVGQILKGDSSFGGTSSVRTRRAVREAAADPDVRGIMLNIDSPGGSVAGIQAAGDAIFEARKLKPVHAHGEDLVASAAYWFASQADRISASPMTEVGSIGTVAMVADSSKLHEDAGIKVHIVSTGEMKGAFAPGTEVTDDQLQWLQERVEAINEFFLIAIKRGRGMSMADVRKLATGEDWLAAAALERGLIDSVETQDEARDNLRREIKRRGSARASRSGRTRRAIKLAELG